MYWPNKDPSDVLDYAIDWSAVLEDETITASSWAVARPSLSIDNDTFGDSRTVVWLSGGLVGWTYTLTNTITTSAGRTFERSVSIKVVER